MAEIKPYTEEDIKALNAEGIANLNAQISQLKGRAIITPEQEFEILRATQFAESKRYPMTREEIIRQRKDGIYLDNSEEQGGVELQNLIEANKIKVYDGTLGGSLDVSTLPDGLRDIYSAPKVTKIVIDPNFDLYNYPLATEGNYFIPFNINSKNADIAAFSKDVLRLTGARNNDELYELLKIDDWRDLIKDAFNIGRGYEDYIDIIYDINIGTYDLKPIAFVARLKYHDPSKQELPEYFNNRVFIGFKKPGYTSEPGERLQELAGDAYIFLNKFLPGPTVAGYNEPIISQKQINTTYVDQVAAENTRIQNELNGKIETEIQKVVDKVDEVIEEVQEYVENKQFKIKHPFQILGGISTAVLAGIAIYALYKDNQRRKNNDLKLV